MESKGMVVWSQNGNRHARVRVVIHAGVELNWRWRDRLSAQRRRLGPSSRTGSTCLHK